MTEVDTNLFVGAIQTFSPPLRDLARRSLKTLAREREDLVCFPQNLIELWNVATRPLHANGLGLSHEQTSRYLDRIQDLVRVLPESPEIFPEWRRLVLQYRVSGIHVHDARIVAAMTVHNVPRILTFDLDDFNRYHHITVIHPSSL